MFIQMIFRKAVSDTVLSVAHGGEFIVKMTERDYNKFKRQFGSQILMPAMMKLQKCLEQDDNGG